jgi:hypothetical protein
MGTQVQDSVFPAPPLARLPQGLFVRRNLLDIFSHRAQMLQRFFAEDVSS